tara:strand:- start:17 stop:1162 length:1146 start_codon:yes stop_codon:yes gene_type:complete
MALSHSPLIVTDGLVFMYDTGNRKSYVGEPTVNLITNSGTSNTGWVGHGWTGSQAISNDYSNTYEFTATNGWHNRTFDTGVTSGGTIYVTFEYKLKQQQTTQNQLFVLNGTHLGSYTNWLGSGSMSFEWQTFSGSFTANANSSKIAIGPRGTDSSGLTDIVYIRNLQVEQKSHATQFVNGTRSATAGLIDRTNNATINLSNVSFDSDAQMTFDGTDDYLAIPHDSSQSFSGDFSIEAVIKGEGSTANCIIQKGSGNDYYQEYWLLQDMRSSPGMFMLIMGGSGNSSANYLSTASNLSQNIYYHVVATVSGSTSKIFVNGVQAASGTISTRIQSTSDLRIGWRVDGFAATNGEIPLTKIYNRALTAAEILQNFNATKSRFGL